MEIALENHPPYRGAIIIATNVGIEEAVYPRP